MKRYNFIKRYYQDILVFIVKNGKLFSFDLLFCYFKTKEELEERKISYIVVDNMTIVKECFFKENNYYLYQLLFSIYLLKKVNLI